MKDYPHRQVLVITEPMETKVQMGPCMECGGDHWMKDCPHRQVPIIKEPVETKVQMGPCMECGGDHWRKDCPHRDPPVVNKTIETNIPFLPIERYCEECYLEHFPRHCDLRSRDDKGKGKIPLEDMEKIPTQNTLVLSDCTFNLFLDHLDILTC